MADFDDGDDTDNMWRDGDMDDDAEMGVIIIGSSILCLCYITN